MATITVPGMFLTGDHASRPAANAVGKGSIYSCTTHSLIYQSDGSSWTTWATLGETGTATHIADTTDAHDASAVSFDATGLDNTTATEVQTALEEFDAAITSASGGGGLTHTYLGYNTIGASTEAVTVRRWFAKKITVATDGVITSIGAYVKQTSAGTTTHMGVGLFEDNAGTPRHLLGANAPVIGTGVFWPEHNSGSAGDARWMHLPIGQFVTAGDYWIGVVFDNTNFQVYKDGSGTDKHWTHATGIRFSDAGLVAITTTTDRYSIRASHIS